MTQGKKKRKKTTTAGTRHRDDKEGNLTEERRGGSSVALDRSCYSSERSKEEEDVLILSQRCSAEGEGPCVRRSNLPRRRELSWAFNWSDLPAAHLRFTFPVKNLPLIPWGPRLYSPSSPTPPSSQLQWINPPPQRKFPDSGLPRAPSLSLPQGVKGMAVPSVHEFHWQSLARLPSGRVYHTLSEVGGQMYMLGGCDAAGRPCPALELYSPERPLDELAPMPTPRAGAAVAVLGKQILVVGGVGEDQSPLKVVEVYNTEEGRWRKRSALREALMGLSIVVKDGRALAVGGMGADLLPRSILQQYDLRKDVWALLPPMPTPRYDANTHLLGNKLYVAGGRQCKRPVKAFEVYDAETRSWTTLPIMPCKRSYGGVIWDATGRLCLLGGLRQGGGHQSSKFTKNVNIFDTNQGAWLKSEETVAMKTKRADFAAAFLRGRMVVAGGLGHEPSALDTVDALHPQRKKWEKLAPMNFPRCSTSSIVIRDRLLVVGGVNQVPSSAHEILYVKEEEYL